MQPYEMFKCMQFSITDGNTGKCLKTHSEGSGYWLLLYLLLHPFCFVSHIGDVQFIDYEYSGYNYLAYDIGNHFNEFAGSIVTWSHLKLWTTENYDNKFLCWGVLVTSVFDSRFLRSRSFDLACILHVPWMYARVCLNQYTQWTTIRERKCNQSTCCRGWWWSYVHFLLQF